MSKRPLVLFSGGVDSTFLLYSHMVAFRSVDVLYVDGGQGPVKIRCEKKARQEILTWLRENASAWHVLERPDPLSKVNFCNMPSATWRQLVPWIIGAIEATDPEKHSSVEVGYLCTDSNAQVFDKVIETWNLLWSICRKGEVVPLVFPLRLQYKSSVMKEMPKELYDLTWVCELPKLSDSGTGEYIHCGSCSACETRLVEEYRQRLRQGIADAPLSEPLLKAVKEIIETPDLFKDPEGVNDVDLEPR